MLFNLFLITLLPIGVTLIFYFLKKKTKFGNLSYRAQQIIIGIVFGLTAICGTEFGVDLNGATANVRDASPLLAGFIFGGPAGIIAGVIGGVERFIASYWGRGFLTQWACSLSTIIAGIYAALLRKYMFENKRPPWGIAIAAAVVMEVFHFVMNFITNILEPSAAMVIIKKLAVPMILANAFAVFVPTFIIGIIHNKYHHAERRYESKEEKRKHQKISTQVQWWLLGSVVICYLFATSLIFVVQTNTAYQDAGKLFNLTINDVKNDVVNNSNTYMLSILDDVKSRYDEKPYDPSKQKECEDYFKELLESNNDSPFDYLISSVDLIKTDERGSFVCSSTSGFEYDSFHMMDADQSAQIHTMMTDPTTSDKPFVQEFMLQGDASEGQWKKYTSCRINDDYYLAISIDSLNFYALIETKVYDITSYRHIKNNGYILIMDRDGEVVSDTSSFGEKKIGITLSSVLANEKLKMCRATVFEEDSYYMYTQAETYSIIVVLPYDDVLSDRDSSFILVSLMEIIIFAVLFAIIYFILKRHVVKKIENVNGSLRKIRAGDLEEKVEVTSSLEFTSLSNDINYAVDTLKEFIDKEKKRLDDELAFSKTIQLSSLPLTFPAFPDRNQFDIFATIDTAKEVGGDFYDFYIIDNNTLAFLIADVSGKGIPAAMFMMEGKAMLKNYAKNLLSPEEVMEKVNEGLAQNNEANMFITCWFGLLNFKTGQIKYANAGHTDPLIYRKNGDWEYLKQKKNIVLAAMEGVGYSLQECTLNPGDKIYLYTDGVTEATRNDGALYGEERLSLYLNSHKDDELEKLLRGVKVDIDTFVEGADQFDDITMLVIEYKGESNH